MSAAERQVIDVSGLPPVGFDTKSTLWWGNLILLLIETTMFAILVGGYFYARTGFSEWPPPRADRGVHILDPLPALLPGTLNVLLLLLSVVTMGMLDKAARRLDQRRVRVLLAVDLAAILLVIVLRAYEFPAMKFKWNDNAYASVVWTLLGMHLLHLIVAAGETAILSAWLFTHKLEEKYAMDVTVGAVYWYWVVGVWLPIYLIIYWAPRFLYTGPRLFF